MNKNEEEPKDTQKLFDELVANANNVETNGGRKDIQRIISSMKVAAGHNNPHQGRGIGKGA